MKENITTTIGCDLGDKQSVLCVPEADGKMERKRQPPLPQ